MAQRTTTRNPEQLAQKASTIDEESAWLFVLRSLSARSQSQVEIERKLAAKGASVAVIESAIERAAGYGYVDDASLAGQLARGMLSRGYGRRRAEQKLRERGLPVEIASGALGEAYGERDELELARAALGRRSITDDADRRRAVAFLARRGFSAGTAWRAVREASPD